MNNMERCVVYKIRNKDYLEEKGEGLSELLRDWLNTNGFDVLVYDFILEDNANIIIDYSFGEKVDIKKLKVLAEKLFKRFNIDFEVEEDNL